MKRELTQAPMKIVRRADIPAITQVEVDGVLHRLGIHQDFRRHPVLEEFLPDSARLSLAWVHLEAGEELAVHAHPTASLIIVTTGLGRCLGDLDSDFAEGDVIVVPAGARHGFVGMGPCGYWALSVQLEGHGLYESLDEARVRFEPPSVTTPGLDRLLALNARLMAEYVRNPLFAFIEGEHVDDRAKRARLLDAIQVWSNFYQKMVLLRCGLADNPEFVPLAEDHLAEEFQHNKRLAGDRGAELARLWDPVLEAGSAWFTWKMLTLDDAAKTALIHLVLEGGSKVFHTRAHPVMARFGETEHFGIHDEADEDHFTMGLKAVEGLTEHQYTHLQVVVTEGWDMLNLICARMADLALQGN